MSLPPLKRVISSHMVSWIGLSFYIKNLLSCSWHLGLLCNSFIFRSLLRLTSHHPTRFSKSVIFFGVGPDFEKRIQGSTIAQGLNSFFGALATSMPVTVYAQNNGVISLSRCAARRGGIACCFWLLIFGIFAKFAAVLLTIPTCVFGAMTTFLFASVMVAGVHVINMQEGLTRRNRFIAIMSLGVGLGVDLVPAWVNITGQALYPNQGNFWPINPNWRPGYRG